jgi:biopolymer transport protein ExbB/TolQ
MDSSHSAAPADKLVKVLTWMRMDPEQRLGFRGGRYTDVNAWLAFFSAAILTGLTYAMLILLPASPLAAMFFRPGSVEIYAAITLLAWWCGAILYLKWRKLRLQRAALGLMVVPHAHDFVLSPASAGDILKRLYGLVDDPAHFMLLCRIERALANLSNIGMIADVSEMLRAQAENDEDHMESSYGLVRGFVWAIPVLGFIGTVLGLSRAIGAFNGVLAAADAVEKLKDALQAVTSGLSLAFETTLVALVVALAIQLLATGLRKREESFLDACKEYCHAHIVSKLRLIQTQSPASAPAAAASAGPAP